MTNVTNTNQTQCINK